MAAIEDFLGRVNLGLTPEKFTAYVAQATRELSGWDLCKGNMLVTMRQAFKKGQITAAFRRRVYHAFMLILRKKKQEGRFDELVEIFDEYVPHTGRDKKEKPQRLFFFSVENSPFFSVGELASAARYFLGSESDYSELEKTLHEARGVPGALPPDLRVLCLTLIRASFSNSEVELADHWVQAFEAEYPLKDAISLTGDVKLTLLLYDAGEPPIPSELRGIQISRTVALAILLAVGKEVIVTLEEERRGAPHLSIEALADEARSIL